MNWATNTSRKKYFFSRYTKYTSKKASNIILRPSVLTKRQFHVLLNYPYNNTKKIICPKNKWMHIIFWKMIGMGESKIFKVGSGGSKKEGIEGGQIPTANYG